VVLTDALLARRPSAPPSVVGPLVSRAPEIDPVALTRPTAPRCITTALASVALESRSWTMPSATTTSTSASSA